MKIPSIAELLDSPQLKPWVDRASRNVVVSSVKTFVERVATDLQSRAAEMNVPTVSELAERIAEWMAYRRATAPHALINATGVLLPDEISPPLADEALHALGASMRDYVTDRMGDRGGIREINSLARQLTGAESSLVTGTHNAAVLLALAAVCRDRPVVIARGQVGQIDPHVTLPQLARCAHVTLRECGIVDRVRPEDYKEVLEGAGAVLIVADARLAREADVLANLEAIVALAQRRQTPVIVVLSQGGLIDLSRYDLKSLPHAATAIERGADLVILPGDRLLGGPSCGIILGRQAIIDQLRQHELYSCLAAPPLVLLPLAATLGLYQDAEVAERAIPLVSLLSTSVDNLKNRAERLAPQLAAVSVVSSARVQQATARVLDSDQLLPLSTWQVVIEPRGMSPQNLADQLAGGVPTVAAKLSESTLILDLRGVLPRQDADIVRAFESLHSAGDKPPEAPVA